MPRGCKVRFRFPRDIFGLRVLLSTGLSETADIYRTETQKSCTLGTPLGMLARKVCAKFHGLIRKTRVNF